VAGLVVTAPGTLDPSTSVATIKSRLAAQFDAAGLGAVFVRASGILGTSHEGHPDIKEAIWDVEAKASIDPGSLRNQLLAALLGRPLSSLSDLPAPVGSPSLRIMVKLTVVTRPGQIAASGAVVNRTDYDSSLGDTAAVADDLANGTALAAAGAGTAFECDIGEASGSSLADIIWVIDESGSMSDNRQDIVSSAAMLYAKSLTVGLDFRMGVTGVKSPVDGSIPGKFCSRASPDPTDDGGIDRFLLPGEQDLFAGCVLNPPYYEPGAEYGLTSAYSALKRHLPRAAGLPDKIREGATLTLIVASDEAPQELKKDEGGSFGGKPGFLTYADYGGEGCALAPAKRAALLDFVKPLQDLLAEAGGQTRMHLIGGACGNGCGAEIAYGYKELAGAFGGHVGDVCQKDVSATIQAIVDNIVAAASPRVLRHVPISSTLAVEANGVPLPRSRTRGFVYSAPTNSLTFVNVKVAKGNRIVAAYRRFIGSR
jgi:hypothetical protein